MHKILMLDFMIQRLMFHYVRLKKLDYNPFFIMIVAITFITFLGFIGGANDGGKEASE